VKFFSKIRNNPMEDFFFIKSFYAAVLFSISLLYLIDSKNQVKKLDTKVRCFIIACYTQ
jgi:hypothetical protein